MLCSAAPEKVSALNLKRLKADNKACGQPQIRQKLRIAMLDLLTKVANTSVLW